MRRLLLIWLFLLPALSASGFAAAGDTFDEGIDYRLVSPPIPTSPPAGKVEVTEFFWYGCPHCYHFEPQLLEWLGKQGDKVSFVRRPSAINPGWAVHAKAFYAAEALGVLDQLHEPLFDAIHKEKRKLFTQEELAGFFAEHGVDKAKFNEYFDSFYVFTKVSRDAGMAQQCCAGGVPAIVVGGKYFVDAALSGGFDKMLKVMDFLVEKAAQERQ